MELVHCVKEYGKPVLKAVVDVQLLRLAVQLVKAQIDAVALPGIVRLQVVLIRLLRAREVGAEIQRNLHFVRVLAEVVLQVDEFIPLLLNQPAQIRRQLLKPFRTVPVIDLCLIQIRHDAADDNRQQRKQNKYDAE